VIIQSALVKRWLMTGAKSRATRMLAGELTLLSVAGPVAFQTRWRGQATEGRLDAARSELYRSYWLAAAEMLGADVSTTGDGPLDISLEGRRTTVWEFLVQLDDPVSVRLALNKPTARARLAASHVPTPEQLVCEQHEFNRAQRFLETVGACTVKPAGTGRGSGVTCGVTTPRDLALAFAFALRWGNVVVLERHISGSEYRMLVLDGEVVSVVRRCPPSVLGDGSSTVGQLVAAENKRRAAAPDRHGLYPITIDLDMIFTLRRAGLSLRSILGDGQHAVVKTAVNENGPHDNEIVAPSAILERAAVSAARAVHLRYAAVEIITPDPNQEFEVSGGAVIEVNGTPGLHYHYQVSNPEGHDPVAVVVLSRLLGRDASASPPCAAGDSDTWV
jgi:cyanophycin synthetase